MVLEKWRGQRDIMPWSLDVMHLHLGGDLRTELVDPVERKPVKAPRNVVNVVVRLSWGEMSLRRGRPSPENKQGVPDKPG
jgi:hypothetical protein